MRMSTVRYINGDKVEKIRVSDMTVSDYESIYKGKIYCPTPNCPAKAVYSGGEKAHFRTWQKKDHLQGCIHEFDRIPINRGIITENSIGVDISFKRRQNALREAFKLMTMTAEEKKEIEEKKLERNIKKKNPRTEGKTKNANVKNTLTGGDVREEEGGGMRGRNLSKRYVDTISNSDINDIRLVMGQLTEVELQNPCAKLTVEWNKKRIYVVFEEAFEKEPSNSAYLNNFGIIKKYLGKTDLVLFTGVGEIRRNRRTEELELVVYIGTDLSFNDSGMLHLR
ncbi:hypothetical protein [Lysinibacillus capsici]|uniref:hypothetical protein n=1 Tax=Lysinibacillus capsici TaxID=2115968 RepID=UPI0021530227|nr:hypothetical protein [Lysinibacillus capsici]MCR6523060.1 hypothetical protein [Lysinibacillus capsici]